MGSKICLRWLIHPEYKFVNLLKVKFGSKLAGLYHTYSLVTRIVSYKGMICDIEYEFVW